MGMWDARTDIRNNITLSIHPYTCVHTSIHVLVSFCCVLPITLPSSTISLESLNYLSLYTRLSELSANIWLDRVVAIWPDADRVIRHSSDHTGQTLFDIVNPVHCAPFLSQKGVRTMNMHQLDYSPYYCTMFQDDSLNFLTIYWQENWHEMPAGSVMVTYYPTNQPIPEQIQPSYCHLMIL